MAVPGNLGRKEPVFDKALLSHEQEKYATNSFDENCVESEFQPDPNYYADLSQTYVALNLNFVKGRDYKTYKTTEK